ncbi:prepilin-type N-terminal cleavage/methylation domain-containing protein [Elusimicrobium simillimum]|uniref:PulJ/GspJ family protein n=1 Tax=Elusimicrobium simillimum TaxID=3143438 RepID=UPI003C6F7384
MINNNKGFTLVEILVALFLTGLVMAGLVGIWVSTSNFASSSREEILFKNAFSVASNRIQKDISEATVVDTASQACGGTSQSTIRIYKNYMFPSASLTTPRCVVGATLSSQKAEAIEYCYNANTKQINRTVYTINCSETFNKLSCFCEDTDTSKSTDFLVGKISQAPVASGSGNLISYSFETSTKVGRNKRPVTLKFDKTFNFLAGNTGF